MQTKCPHCGRMLREDGYDGYEKYLTCGVCAREFELNMLPRRMTPQELKKRTGIYLPNAKESARIEV